MERLIFHIDVNSAYLSWESARRLKEGKEDLRLIPACIGGDPKKRTGVVLAKSIPAKRFGICTVEPMGAALRKCPQLVIAPPDFSLYQQYSEAFLAICRRYAPALEQFSIDECFLDMTGTRATYPDPIALAYEIKNVIRDTLGFTVNVGIARNKLLAKMASDFEKPDRVHTLFPDELENKLWPLPVGQLLTVGKTTANKLQKAGIATIGDLAQQPAARLQAMLGKKWGIQLHAYANGIDHSPVIDVPQKAKGYSISTTVEDNVSSAEQANHILLTLVIYETAKQLFSALWDRHTPLRLLGISLTDVTWDENEQLSLFANPKHEKERKLDRAVDAIRKKYGMDTIARGAVLGDKHIVGKKYRAQVENKRKR